MLTLSRTLLPAHHREITKCLDEHLAKAAFEERVRLVSFLLQLHPHFPSWRLLSWEAVVQAIDEDELGYDRERYQSPDQTDQVLNQFQYRQLMADAF